MHLPGVDGRRHERQLAREGASAFQRALTRDRGAQEKRKQARLNFYLRRGRGGCYGDCDVVVSGRKMAGLTMPRVQSPRASRLAPRASRLAPRASRLAPRASRLAPRASRLAPRASRLAPRASRLAPRASRLAPRASRLFMYGAVAG